MQCSRFLEAIRNLCKVPETGSYTTPPVRNENLPGEAAIIGANLVLSFAIVAMQTVPPKITIFFKHNLGHTFANCVEAKLNFHVCQFVLQIDDVSFSECTCRVQIFCFVRLDSV